MTATTTDARTNIRAAVRLAREYRHHRDCRCGIYRRDDNLFCTVDEWRWEQTVNQLIDACRELR